MSASAHSLWQNCEFIKGVVALEGLPADERPEIAFAGRSNVGKSSLLNALTGRKALARTSHTPGRTQELNFFKLGDETHSAYLVDMPGYGYAKVSKSQRKGWTDLIRSYLRGRSNLRCVFLLIDSRHGLKESDEEMMSLMDEAGVAYRIILTKTDKMHKSQLDKTIQKTEEALKKHTAAFPETLLSSANEKTGLEEIQDITKTLLGF